MTRTYENSIDAGSPALASASRPAAGGWTLQSADSDGVAVVLTQSPSRVLTATELSGALIESGKGYLAAAAARNITITTSADAGAFAVGAKITVEGKDSNGNAVSETFTLTDDGTAGETLVGSKMFAGGAGNELTIKLPALSGDRVVGTVPGPWNFAPADTLVMVSPAAETATFDAGVPSDTATGPFDLTDAETLTITLADLRGDPSVPIAIESATVVFDETPETGNCADIAAVTAAEIEAAFAMVNVTVEDGSGTLTVAGKEACPVGTDGQITLSGAAADVLAMGTENVIVGTGDVGNIDAVTPAEFKAVVEADTTGITVDINADNTVTLRLTTPAASDAIAVNASSKVEAIVGLDVLVHTVGEVTIGAGVAREVYPPARWIWANATGLLYASLVGDVDGKIGKYDIASKGSVPLAVKAVHANSVMVDFEAIIK